VTYQGYDEVVGEAYIEVRAAGGTKASFWYTEDWRECGSAIAYEIKQLSSVDKPQMSVTYVTSRQSGWYKSQIEVTVSLVEFWTGETRWTAAEDTATSPCFSLV
jgi:hypothetical protein